MHIIETAYTRLYPEKEFFLIPKLKYSGKFKDFNANVSLKEKVLEFSLSKKWETISDEIKIGLLQELMYKLFKAKKRTYNMDLYDKFVKNLHLAIPKNKTHPILEDSYCRVNEKYFFGIIEQPNLVWGNENTTELGNYNFNNDTITISKIFYRSDADLLDLVMYHELLHKKHKFYTTGRKTMFHTSSFRKDEKKFENFGAVERKLNYFLGKQKVKKFFKFR